MNVSVPPATSRMGGRFLAPRRRLVVGAILGGLLCASPVAANPFTAAHGAILMWLMVGNAVLGLVEGIALHLLSRKARTGTIPLLIMANYASAWLAGALGADCLSHWLDFHVGSPPVVYALLLGGTLLLGIVIEFPFVVVAMWRTSWGWGGLVAWHLAIQLATNTLTFGCIIANVPSDEKRASVQVVTPAELPLPPGVRVYFVAPGGRLGFVEAGEDGVERSVVDGPHVPPSWGGQITSWWEFVRADAKDGEASTTVEEVSAMGPATYHLVSRATLLVEGLHGVPPIMPTTVVTEVGVRDLSTGYDLGVPVLADRADVAVPAGIPMRGWGGLRTPASRLMISEPFALWYPSAASQIDPGLFVLALGGHQVCLYEAATRRIRRLATGWAPVPFRVVPVPEATEVLPAAATPGE